jgi:hypothetical protein
VFPQSGHEMAEGREASHKSLDILDIPDLAYFRDSRDLIGVCFNAALADDVPQEFAPGDLKGALFQVQLDVEVPEVSKSFFQVGIETATLSGLYNDVINIDLQVAPDLSFEIELHTPLLGGPHIL